MRIFCFAAIACFFSTGARADGLWDELQTPGRGRYQQLLVEAHRLRVGGDYPGAARALLDATRVLPDDVAAWIMLGEVRTLEHDWRDARAAFERARALQPESPDPALALRLAHARAADGDFDGSLAEYRRAEAAVGPSPPLTPFLQLAPSEAWMLPYDLGDTYMALGRLGEAIAAYRRAAALEPRKAILHFALAVALDRDEQLGASRVELDTALTYDRDLRELRGGEYSFVPPADLHYYVALAHLARRRLAAGRAELRSFLVELPSGPYAARARDRLAAVPNAVDERELGGSGFDGKAVADKLSPLRAEAERCVGPGEQPLLTIHLTQFAATNRLLAPDDEKCLDKLLAPVEKALPRNASVDWPLARPTAGAPLPVDR